MLSKCLVCDILAKSFKYVIMISKVKINNFFSSTHMNITAAAFVGLILSTFCSNTAWAGQKTINFVDSREVFVGGYYRQNGTYVSPYIRTAPNKTRNDNWSTVGNINPYTGRAGRKEGDSATPTTYTYPNFGSLYEPLNVLRECDLTAEDGKVLARAWYYCK